MKLDPQRIELRCSCGRRHEIVLHAELRGKYEDQALWEAAFWEGYRERHSLIEGIKSLRERFPHFDLKRAKDFGEGVLARQMPR